MKDPPRPTAIDLFAGAGGSSQGLIDAGFRILAAIERDEDAAATFVANHPNVRVLPKDIACVSPNGLRTELGLAPLDLTLLTACPPCQGFSSLGSRNSRDERNDLVYQVYRFTRAFRPAAVLLENVPGLAKDPRWSALRQQLRASGYGVRSWNVDAAQFGVAQRRRRMIAIAIRRGNSPLPNDVRELLPHDFQSVAPHANEVIGRAGAIEGSADECHRSRTLSAAVLERVKAIPEGGNHFDLPDELQLACHKKLRARGRTTATGPYGRIPLEGPAPTMTTRCTTVSCGRFIHPSEDRGISLREAALLQSFPEDYLFMGSYGSIERQIGNAVPVRLAHALGLVVRELLDE